MATDLKAELSKKTVILDLKVWEVIGIAVGLFIIIILSVLSLCLTSQKKSRRTRDKIPLSQIPTVSKEIKEVRVEQVTTDEFVPRDGILLTIHDKSSDKESDKVLVHSQARWALLLYEHGISNKFWFHVTVKSSWKWLF